MKHHLLLLLALLGACGSSPPNNEWVPPPPPLHQPDAQVATPGDTDGDGIPDANDKCPADPETKNGVDDEDGCPDRECVFVKQFPECADEQLYFNRGRFTPDGNAPKILDGLGAVLVDAPDVKLVELRGYRARNEAAKLSLQRAEAVQAALVKRGVEAARLAIIDGGISDASVADAIQRRVEMEITRQQITAEDADQLVCTAAGRVFIKLTPEQRAEACQQQQQQQQH